MSDYCHRFLSPRPLGSVRTILWNLLNDRPGYSWMINFHNWRGEKALRQSLPLPVSHSLFHLKSPELHKQVGPPTRARQRLSACVCSSLRLKYKCLHLPILHQAPGCLVASVIHVYTFHNHHTEECTKAIQTSTISHTHNIKNAKNNFAVNRPNRQARTEQTHAHRNDEDDLGQVCRMILYKWKDQKKSEHWIQRSHKI